MELADFISLLPAQWAAYAIVALQVLGWANNASALLAPLLKSKLGTPQSSDGELRQFGFWLAKWLDRIAVNTQKLADKKHIEQLQAKLAEHERELLRKDDLLSQRDVRIVDLTAKLIDNRETIARQASNLVQTMKLVPKAPDNDNGTVFQDIDGINGGKTGGDAS